MNRLPHTKCRLRAALPVAAWTLPVVVAGIALPAVAPARAAAQAAARAGEGRLATGAELRQMRDDGQYRLCLQQIGRILRSSNVDKAYGRYDLLLLRGDCLLHLEDAETARLGQQLAVAFDGDPKLWDPLIYRALKAVRAAQDVLEAE